MPLKDLNDAQRQALRTLLQSALSTPGYDKVFNAIALEGILSERLRSYDPNLHYVSVFAEPSMDKPSGWRFEGHHLWRDFKGDFGRDLLQEHYAQSGHARSSLAAPR